MAKDKSKGSVVYVRNKPVLPPPVPQKQADEDENDFPEAFEDGKDYQASGDVNHYSRTVSRALQNKWDAFAGQFQNGVTQREENSLMKDWDGSKLYGYFRTTNAMEINKALNDPKNAGKTDAQIFTRTDRRGVARDLQTVQTLDKVINNNKTLKDASYTRFGTPASVQRAYGFTAQQMQMINNAPNMTAAQLKQLNSAIKGETSMTYSYTSTSANRSMNAFGNPNARQSIGYTIERKINVPKGTNAYAPKQNAQESEVLFGRRMQTKLDHISVSKDGHIVFHEKFDGYK